MADYLGNLGGEIVTGHRVDTLDELPTADSYLLDVMPAAAAAMAGDRIGRSKGRLENWAHGPGVFKVDWALNDPIPWADPWSRRAGTVHVGGTIEEVVASEAAATDGRLTDRPFVLVSQPTLIDHTRAPEGKHVAWAYCHVPHGSPADMTLAIETQIERFAPGFRDTIIARHTMGPAEFAAYNVNYVGGDIGGGALNISQLLARPRLSSNPYRIGRDVYLCSSATPPGAGVHGMCGYHAATVALEDAANR
jgi:phytoene dehydrogenase-like protein